MKRTEQKENSEKQILTNNYSEEREEDEMEKIKSFCILTFHDVLIDLL